ncbi:hypothetical protein K0M31_019761 [Melipona bicolor]|uniref:Uncharacterized protein n=1 Tax=Melipona bicolor TaxID=60889 RepID=A0AA40KRR0_9HYME|nr:hypothetical protein K0M31_019761 [Melipona bicolor]
MLDEDGTAGGYKQSEGGRWRKMDRAAERLQEGKAVAMGLWMARVHVENQLENPVMRVST